MWEHEVNRVYFDRIPIKEDKEKLKEKYPHSILTNTQKIWFKFCLTMMILTNSINWDKFERFSLKSYKAKALGFIFHHAKINKYYDKLLRNYD